MSDHFSGPRASPDRSATSATSSPSPARQPPGEPRPRDGRCAPRRRVVDVLRRGRVPVPGAAGRGRAPRRRAGDRRADRRRPVRRRPAGRAGGFLQTGTCTTSLGGVRSRAVDAVDDGRRVSGLRPSRGCARTRSSSTSPRCRRRSRRAACVRRPGHAAHLGVCPLPDASRPLHEWYLRRLTDLPGGRAELGDVIALRVCPCSARASTSRTPAINVLAATNLRGGAQPLGERVVAAATRRLPPRSSKPTEEAHRAVELDEGTVLSGPRRRVVGVSSSSLWWTAHQRPVPSPCRWPSRRFIVMRSLHRGRARR